MSAAGGGGSPGRRRARGRLVAVIACAARGARARSRAPRRSRARRPRRRGACVQCGRQRDRVGPAEPLAQPVGQRLPGFRDVGIGKAREQPDERRAAQRRARRCLHHAANRQKAAVYTSPGGRPPESGSGADRRGGRHTRTPAAQGSAGDRRLRRRFHRALALALALALAPCPCPCPLPLPLPCPLPLPLPLPFDLDLDLDLTSPSPLTSPVARHPSPVTRRPPPADRGSRIADRRPPTADRRPPTADRRPPTANIVRRYRPRCTTIKAPVEPCEPAAAAPPRPGATDPRRQQTQPARPHTMLANLVSRLRDRFGKPPTPQAFAERLIATLRASGDTRTWRHEDEKGCLVQSDVPSNIINLHNLFHDYAAAKPSERDTVLKRQANAMMQHEIPTDFAAAREAAPRDPQRDRALRDGAANGRAVRHHGAGVPAAVREHRDRHRIRRRVSTSRACRPRRSTDGASRSTKPATSRSTTCGPHRRRRGRAAERGIPVAIRRLVRRGAAAADRPAPPAADRRRAGRDGAEPRGAAAHRRPQPGGASPPWSTSPNRRRRSRARCRR